MRGGLFILIMLVLIVGGNIVYGKNSIGFVNHRLVVLYDDFSSINTSVWSYYQTSDGHYTYTKLNGRTLLKVWDDSQHCGVEYVKIYTKKYFDPPIFLYVNFKILDLRRGNPSFGFMIDNNGKFTWGTVLNLCTDAKIPNFGVFHNGSVKWKSYTKNQAPFLDNFVVVSMSVLPGKSVINYDSYHFEFDNSISNDDKLVFYISGGTCCYGCSCGGCDGSGQSVLGYDWVIISKARVFYNMSFVL